jgi:hypothetical protein
MYTRKMAVLGLLAVVLSLTGCEQPTNNTPTVTLTGITANYTGGSVEINTDVNSLKSNLTVTANYSDNASRTLNSADYSLSGDLSVSGQKTITVTYEDKTTNFTVTVTAAVAANNDITYNVTQTDGADGTADTTAINFTFSGAVSDLTANDITITNSTNRTGSVTKGVLSGSGTSWSLAVTVAAPGNVTVSIIKTGIETGTKNVTVYKVGQTIPTLTDITAVYTQGSTIVYPTTPLDSLKAGLTVTAQYSDSTTQPVTAYALSGTLTVGTSAVTVSYTDGVTQTTTFNVTVTASSSSVDTAGLEAAIQAAYDAKDNVKEAANADEVATGIFWVTAADMKSLNDAIDAAETVRDSAATQAAVDAAKTTLAAATVAFNTAKKQGTATAITLSGTITIKNNGQIVPYVHIQLHDKDWAWREETRLSTSAGNTPWSIITKSLDVETAIVFRITGYQSDEFVSDTHLFEIEVKDLPVSVKDEDISDINIDLANLKLITLSGTINVSYDGKPIPSLSIEVYRENDGFYLGGTPYMFSVGNNTPWSIQIEAVDEDMEIRFNIVGSNHIWDVWSEEDRLFAFWGQDFGVTIKDQNKSDVAIKLITISGTINVTYNGNVVPYVYLDVDSDEDGQGWLGNTMLTAPAANAKWTIVVPVFDTVQKNLKFWVAGAWESDWDWDLFNKEIETNYSIKDQNLSGVTLNLGNIEDD